MFLKKARITSLSIVSAFWSKLPKLPTQTRKKEKKEEEEERVLYFGADITEHLYRQIYVAWNPRRHQWRWRLLADKCVTPHHSSRAFSLYFYHKGAAMATWSFVPDSFLGSFVLCLCASHTIYCPSPPPLLPFLDSALHILCTSFSG